MGEERTERFLSVKGKRKIVPVF